MRGTLVAIRGSNEEHDGDRTCPSTSLPSETFTLDAAPSDFRGASSQEIFRRAPEDRRSKPLILHPWWHQRR